MTEAPHFSHHNGEQGVKRLGTTQTNLSCIASNYKPIKVLFIETKHTRSPNCIHSLTNLLRVFLCRVWVIQPRGTTTSQILNIHFNHFTKSSRWVKIISKDDVIPSKRNKQPDNSKNFNLSGRTLIPKIKINSLKEVTSLLH